MFERGGRVWVHFSKIAHYSIERQSCSSMTLLLCLIMPSQLMKVRFPAAMKHFAAVAAEKLATVLGGAPWTAEGQRRSEDAQRVKFARSHMTS